MSAVMDPADDSNYVKTTDFIDGRVRVGTFDFSDGVDQRVVYYAPKQIAVKVTDLFTVETIQKGDKDPLVDRLLNEHCAASPDGDLVEYTQDEGMRKVSSELERMQLNGAFVAAVAAVALLWYT